MGRFTLVDLDDICVSNVNRQIHAVEKTIGHSKAKILGDRIYSIHPDATVNVVEEFFTESTAASILDQPTDVVVDAIDSFENKCLLLDNCRARSIQAVVVGGAGGRVDPTRIRISDISMSRGDRLLAMVRKRLRQKRGFPRSGHWGVPCVYSDEPRRFPDGNGGICSVQPGPQNTRLDCATGFGAATYVTGTFGFYAAKAAIDLILA